MAGDNGCRTLQIVRLWFIPENSTDKHFNWVYGSHSKWECGCGCSVCIDHMQGLMTISLTGIWVIFSFGAVLYSDWSQYWLTKLFLQARSKVENQDLLSTRFCSLLLKLLLCLWIWIALEIDGAIEIEEHCINSGKKIVFYLINPGSYCYDMLV